jgi:putative phage-type endonuclease
MGTDSTTKPASTVPDGILIGHLTPGTAAWEEARTGLTITATEIAAVVGLSPWMSRFTLWHKKAGLPTPPFEMNPAIEWGNRLEDAVADKWQDEHPGQLAAPAGTWKHREREWQRATPDRLIYPQPADEFDVPEQAVGLLEVKTSPFGDEWGPDGAEDGVPIHYRCQVIWQMDVLGLRRTEFAVLISGHDYREYVVEYDEADATILRDAAERFLYDVRQGVPPEIDGSEQTYSTIRLQPDRYDPIDVEIPGPIASDYEVIGAQYKAVGEQYTQAKSRLLAALGTGKNAMHLGRRIAYRVANEDGTTKQLQPAR